MSGHCGIGAKYYINILKLKTDILKSRTKDEGDTARYPSVSIHVFTEWSLGEVKNPESGASELYDPQVLLSNGEATWLEPLSRHWLYPAPYPGKVQWLPPTAGPGIEGSEALMMSKTY